VTLAVGSFPSKPRAKIPWLLQRYEVIHVPLQWLQHPGHPLAAQLLSGQKSPEIEGEIQITCPWQSLAISRSQPVAAVQVTLLRYAVRTASETSLAFQQEYFSPCCCSFLMAP